MSVGSITSTAVSGNTAAKVQEEAGTKKAEEMPDDRKEKVEGKEDIVPENKRFDKYEKGPKAPEEQKCTVDTGKVDAEIRKLREEKQQIQQQITQAENEEERAGLERRLAEIESRLQEMDNDTYRKQHAEYSYS